MSLIRSILKPLLPLLQSTGEPSDERPNPAARERAKTGAAKRRPQPSASDGSPPDSIYPMW